MTTPSRHLDPSYIPRSQPDSPVDSTEQQEEFVRVPVPELPQAMAAVSDHEAQEAEMSELRQPQSPAVLLATGNLNDSSDIVAQQQQQQQVSPPTDIVNNNNTTNSNNGSPLFPAPMSPVEPAWVRAETATPSAMAAATATTNTTTGPPHPVQPDAALPPPPPPPPPPPAPFKSPARASLPSSAAPPRPNNLPLINTQIFEAVAAAPLPKTSSRDSIVEIYGDNNNQKKDSIATRTSPTARRSVSPSWSSKPPLSGVAAPAVPAAVSDSNPLTAHQQQQQKEQGEIEKMKEGCRKQQLQQQEQHPSPPPANSTTAGAAATTATATAGASPPPPPSSSPRDPADDPDHVEKYHSIPNPRSRIAWNQRVPNDRAIMQSFIASCGFCLAPKFWKRFETSARNSLIAWLPSILILLSESWRASFKFPFQLPISVIFVNGSKFGEFPMKIVDLCKALFVAIAASMVITWAPVNTHTENVGKWIGFWLYYFIAIIILSVFTYGGNLTRAVPYFFSAFMLRKWFFSSTLEDFSFYAYYLRDTAIGVAFAVAPSFLPFPSFAMHRAEELLQPMANSISILVQGAVISAWSKNIAEQRLDLVRLRQIRAHLRDVEGHISYYLGIAWWEPFSSLRLARLQARFNLFASLSVKLSSFVRLVDQIANDRPDVTSEDSTFSKFGVLLKADVDNVLEKLDSTILRISDCSSDAELITPEEMRIFKTAVQRFMDSLLRARSKLYYGEAMATFQLSTVDLYSAHFFFFLEEILDAIVFFKEPQQQDVEDAIMAASTLSASSWLWWWCCCCRSMCSAVVGNIVAVWDTAVSVTTDFTNPRNIAAFKNAIKLSLAMIAAASLSYGLPLNITSPSLIALMHADTSTFLWSLQYVEGVVAGGVFAQLCLTIAGSNYAIQVVLFAFLFFAAEFVKTSPAWLSAGIAGLIQLASMLLPGNDEKALVTQLTTMLAAMTIHLVLTSFLLWPSDPIQSLRHHIDSSIGLFRDGVCTLLTQLRPHHLDPSVSRTLYADIRAKLRGTVGVQRELLPAARAEPSLVGSVFPLSLYVRVVDMEERMLDLFSNLAVAFTRIQESKVDPNDKRDLHWPMIRIIKPLCGKFADHISALTDLILLLMREGSTSVPTSQLVQMSQEALALATQTMHLRNSKVNKIRAKKYARVLRRREKRRAMGLSVDNVDERRKGEDGHDDDGGGGSTRRSSENYSDDGGEGEQIDSDEDIRDMLEETSDDGVDVGSPRSSGMAHHRQSSRGSFASAGLRRPKEKPVDPLLGQDVDSIQVHASSSLLVAQVGVARLLSELLEALLDIQNWDEISRSSS